MEVDSVLVTGANRGIGLEFVRQMVNLPKPPKVIFATYRRENSLKALKDIRDSAEKSTVRLLKVDVTNVSQIETMAETIEQALGENGLNLLINNAGVAHSQPIPYMTPENLSLHFSINSVAPVMIAQRLLPLLEKAASKGGSGKNISKAAILNISSSIGSLTNIRESFPLIDSYPGYRISKAALNMAMRMIADFIKEKDILVSMMCPGWVKTDMGSDEAELDLDKSIETILKTLAALNETHHGAYIDRFGNPIPF